mgnify:FL=1|tara:strand:+ start:1808 stop:2719 length:912 start_codon:yes stop_codon:yes gene_type:complete
MRKLLIFTVITGIFFSCGSEPKNKKPFEGLKKEPPLIKTKNTSNLNISILLDLSDRIDTVKYSNPSMEFYKRDVGYLKSVAEVFSNSISYKKSRHLDDKIQLYFDPEPINTQINDLSKELKFHISRDNGTKEYINKISDTYASIGLKIYEQALKDDNYVGSDTWGFLKNKVQDYCIDENYRNILVIITDGYIYYENNTINEGNLSSYITPKKIRNKNLNTSNWKQLIESNKHGFIPIDQDLSNLEVLVLGVNPSKTNNYDYDVLNKYWSDWLFAMGVNEENFEFKMADLPSNMDNIINKFISN